jgi:hypothetical protein
MAFLFKMTFTGLCAFVPSDPPGSGTVLLLNTQGSADDLNFHGSLDPHVPRMRLQSGTPSLAGKVLSYSVVAPATIEPNTLQLVDATFPPPLPTQPAAGTEQERGVFWIANMAEIEGGNVNDSCFGTLLNNTLVTARVKLSAGSLTTSRMAEEPNGKDIIWNFKKSSSSVTPTLIRAMAAEFSLAALVNGDAININILDPVTGATSSQTLQPVGGEVVVQIENSCFRSNDPNQLGRPLNDFAFFYRLAGPHGALHLPYPTEGGDLSDTLCPPARFPAHPLA